MDQFGLHFHHIGLAVRHPKKALHFLNGIGYSINEPLLDHQQNVTIIWCTHTNMPSIEVVYPAEDKGPLDNLLSTSEHLVYHLCYTSENLESSLQSMKDASLRVICVSQQKPAVLFNNQYVSFHLVQGFGLIEIIETSLQPK